MIAATVGTEALSLSNADTFVRQSRRRGERFYCAWHPRFPNGILRRHTNGYVDRHWKNRNWFCFDGASPDIADVSSDVSNLYAELLSPLGIASWPWTRVVFDGQRLRAYVSQWQPSATYDAPIGGNLIGVHLRYRRAAPGSDLTSSLMEATCEARSDKGVDWGVLWAVTRVVSERTLTCQGARDFLARLFSATIGRPQRVWLEDARNELEFIEHQMARQLSAKQ